MTERQERRFVDATKVKSGATYPVCARLPALFLRQGEEEARRYDVEQGYQTLLDAGQLNCGKKRVGWGLVGKKHYEPWLRGCVPEILPAKRRLLGFLQELCDEQHSVNSAPASSSTDMTNSAVGPTGVVFTGKGEHLRDSLQSVLGLRLLNVSLPVEVWVNARDEVLCRRVFHASGAAALGVGLGPLACRALPNAVSGFASKFYALLGSDLRHALFVDADNLAARDVAEVFASAEYRATGALLWPDLWGERCRGVAGQTNGESGYRTHALWAAEFGGLEWRDDRVHAQEAEAGQVALDLRRHAGLLRLGLRIIEDRAFLKRVVNGDKDIFRLVFLLAEEPFTFVPHLPGYSIPHAGAQGRDCLVHFLGPPDDAYRAVSPLFFHQVTLTLKPTLVPMRSLITIPFFPPFLHQPLQLKARDPLAFGMARRWPMAARGDASACIDLSARPELPALEVETFPDAARLRDHAARTFALTDRLWAEGGLEVALAQHEGELWVADMVSSPALRSAALVLLLGALLLLWRWRSRLGLWLGVGVGVGARGAALSIAHRSSGAVRVN